MRKAAERGSAAAQGKLGLCHLQGAEGLQIDHVRAVAFFRKAAAQGLVQAYNMLAACYDEGWGVDKNGVQAVAWWRQAADRGDVGAQQLVGRVYALGAQGVKKDLPLGKRYLELSAAQGDQAAVTLLKRLRKCLACGKLDVHRMICSQCRRVRYCDGQCQLVHWQSATDPHKLHCFKRRESAEAGGSSAEHADLSGGGN